jgi:hypothetical protein
MSVEIEVESEGLKSKPKKYGKYDEYEIENAMRTLMDAEKIKADKEKMKYVKQCMAEQKGHIESTIGSMDDLKAAREKAYEDEESEESES